MIALRRLRRLFRLWICAKISQSRDNEAGKRKQAESDGHAGPARFTKRPKATQSRALEPAHDEHGLFTTLNPLTQGEDSTHPGPAPTANMIRERGSSCSMTPLLVDDQTTKSASSSASGSVYQASADLSTAPPRGRNVTASSSSSVSRLKVSCLLYMHHIGA